MKNTHYSYNGEPDESYKLAMSGFAGYESVPFPNNPDLMNQLLSLGYDLDNPHEFDFIGLLPSNNFDWKLRDPKGFEEFYRHWHPSEEELNDQTYMNKLFYEDPLDPDFHH